LVGGDWYDVFPLPDGRILLSIGDVAGSGLHAAVIMASIRQSIRTAALINPEPLSILDAGDRIVRSVEHDQFVTAFIGILDPVFGELAYACAGHPSPLLRRADGTVEAISRGDLPLGLRQADCGESFVIKLEPGSLLTFYTDGLTEFEHDLIAGEKKLTDALRELSNSRHPAQDLYQSVLGGQPRHDDVAILIVTFDAPPENTREHEAVVVPVEFTVIRSG
jgi:serine phosphatase RsbU (regulator of sigma subunit)